MLIFGVCREPAGGQEGVDKVSEFLGSRGGPGKSKKTVESKGKRRGA